MKIGKRILLFCIGGLGYVSLEWLWRGWSHGSMFLAGGGCFLLLGKTGAVLRRRPVAVKAMAGAGLVTAVELMAGLAVNRNYNVWDYRNMPINFLGQICLPYFLLWMPLSLCGMGLYQKLDSLIPHEMSKNTFVFRRKTRILQNYQIRH